ncbi:MAG TPA: DUF2147 domain-containing protein [Acidobacteriaceae bacterium]|nr:DUF2147 domain-containing protein [Acidobacteriaceae bacterium]
MAKYFVVMVICLFAPTAFAQQTGIFGNWSDPTGSVIQIFPCGPDACARIIAISSKAPGRVDANNPNPALRKRPLCGLQIGSSFQLTGPTRAQGGWLYDPQSGRTYHGTMTQSGAVLHLRGYIGLSIFGRTETWTRASNNLSPCQS